MKTLKAEGVCPMALETFADAAADLPRFTAEVCRDKCHNASSIQIAARQKTACPLKNDVVPTVDGFPHDSPPFRRRAEIERVHAKSWEETPLERGRGTATPSWFQPTDLGTRSEAKNRLQVVGRA